MTAPTVDWRQGRDKGQHEGMENQSMHKSDRRPEKRESEMRNSAVEEQQAQDQDGFVFVIATIDHTPNEGKSSGTTVRTDWDDDVGHDFVFVETESSGQSTRIVSDPERNDTRKNKELKTSVAKPGREITPLKESVASLGRSALGSSTSNGEIREMKTVSRVAEMTTSRGLVVRKTDSISLTEVATLVGELNAQIEQLSSLVMDLLPSQESPRSNEREGLRDYLGSWLCHELQRRSNKPEIDHMVAYIALQTGLVYACNRIINDWNPPFWNDGSAHSRVYNTLIGVEGQATADTWKVLTRNCMSLREDQLEANKKYLEEVLLMLIPAVGGPLKSDKMVLQLCDEKLDDIAKRAFNIHQVISREVISTDLSTFIVAFGTEFDQSRMEDTEGSSGKLGPNSLGKVICTVEMGLRARKRLSIRQQRENGKEDGVTMKAKVVLPAALYE